MCNEANIKLSPSKFLPHCSPCITIHCFLREDELHWVKQSRQPKQPQPRGNYLYPVLSTGFCCVKQSVLSFLTRWKIILTSQDRVMFPKLHVDTRSWSPHFSLTAPQSYLLIRLKMIRRSQASTLYKCRQVRGGRGRAAAVWGEKDERKASLARPQQSPSRGGDSGDDPGSDDQLSGSRRVSRARRQ